MINRYETLIRIFVPSWNHVSLSAQSVRERILLDDGWQFAFGNASSPEKDFGCGTEYFNYLTKAASIHNEGPYSPKFNPESGCGLEDGQPSA